MKLQALAAIAGIVILDAIALANGVDGVLLMTSIGIISGLGGYPVLHFVLKKGFPEL